MTSCYPQYALCLNCYEIFNPSVIDPNANVNICPKMTCGYDNIILVDENMLPIIISLNKKGYKTRNCCSGHIWDDDLYIQFEDKIDFETIPTGFNLSTESYDSHPRNILRISQDYQSFQELSYADRQSLLFDRLSTLSKWVEELPMSLK